MRAGSRILLLFYLTAVCAIPSHARQPDSLSVPRRGERVFARTQYEYVYRDNPAMLSWWDYATYSVIGAALDYGNGGLHHPQTYDRMLKGGVETESILHMPEKGWSFHGRFFYENGVADSVRANLSYGLRSNGTPSFYFCRQPASRWNIQRYGLEASVSKRLGEQWSLGGQFDYRGDLAFRKSDVRNEQTTLDIHAVLSVSRRFGEHHLVSAGVDYLRSKERPSFSIVYSTGENYMIYLMNGLGTYITDQTSEMVWVEHAPSLLLQWMQTSAKNRFSLTYRFVSGSNRWRYRGSQSAARQDKWTKYDYASHRIVFSETLRTGRSLLNVRGDADFTVGKGNSWSRTGNVFIQNYDYKGVTGTMTVEWRPLRSVLQQVAVGGNYSAENRRDKSYDYRFEHAAITAFVQAQAGFEIGSVDLDVALEGSYLHSLRVGHKPNAAVETNNEYTRWVGIPLAEWLATDIARVGVSFGTEIPVRRNLLEIGAVCDYSIPVQKNLTASYDGSDFLRVKVFVNVYF